MIKILFFERFEFCCIRCNLTTAKEHYANSQTWCKKTTKREEIRNTLSLNCILQGFWHTSHLAVSVGSFGIVLSSIIDCKDTVHDKLKKKLKEMHLNLRSDLPPMTFLRVKVSAKTFRWSVMKLNWERVRKIQSKQHYYNLLCLCCNFAFSWTILELHLHKTVIQ